MKSKTNKFVYALLMSLMLPGLAFASIKNNEDTRQISPIVNRSTTDEGASCEEWYHMHEHVIDDNDTRRKDYFAEVHSIAIELSDDFLEYIDTENMGCSDGGNSSTWKACGFDPIADLGTEIYSISGGNWGGTSITYQELDWIAGDPKGLVWEYGTTNSKKKPILLDNPDNMFEGITFHPLDETVDFVAKSTGWTKLEFYHKEHDEALNKTGSRAHWHNTYPDYVDTDNDGTDDVGVDSDGDYVFWYGKKSVSTPFTACEEPPPTCTDLEVTVNGETPFLHDGTYWLDVEDVYTTVEIDVQAISDDATGSPLSDYGDVEYRYRHMEFGNPWFLPSADRNWRKNLFGLWRPITQNSWLTNNNTVRFANSQPGDKIEIETVFEGTHAGEQCEVHFEFPYCLDLNLLNPTGVEIITGTEIEEDITTTAVASNGEDWTYDLTYTSTDATATYDPNLDGTYEEGNPYTGQGVYAPMFGRTRVGYYSTNSASVDIEAVDDVAGSCQASFTYALYTPPAEFCLFAEFLQPISQPSPITLSNADLEAGAVPIEWTAILNTGLPDHGPWQITTTDGNGDFYLDSSLTTFLGDGTGFVTPNVVLYLDGNSFTPGESIVLTHASTDAAPECDLLINTEILYCEDLEITIPTSNITETEMAAGMVEIQWTSTLTDGSANPGPFLVEAINPATGAYASGTFYEDAAGTTDLGNPATYDPATFGPPNRVYYDGGSPSDQIVITDQYIYTTAACIDTLESELTPPVCTDLTLSDTYIFDSSGTRTDIDLSDPTDLATAYAAGEMCWDYSVVYSDTETFTVFANVTGGTATITDGATSADGATGITYTDTTATGTICWTGFSEGDTIDIFADPDSAGVCSQSITLPELPELPVCEDLTMLDSDGGTSYTMAEEDVDAGTIELNIDIAASTGSWTGTLIVEHSDGSGTAGTGAGELLYSDSSTSSFGDGHLEITPVIDGDSITVYYEGGQAGDVVYAYIQSEEALCSDEYNIVQDSTPEGDDDDDDRPGTGVNLCRDLNFRADADDIEIGEDFDVNLAIDSNRSSGTLIVEYNCEGETIYLEGYDEVGERFDEKSKTGRLEVEDVDRDASFKLTFTNVCAEVEIVAYVEGRESACYDELNLEGYCEDVEFDIPTYDYGEDTEVCVDIESGLEDQDLEITYYCPQGDEIIEYEGERYDGELQIDGINGSEEVCFTLEDLCPGAEIEAIVNDDRACMDTVDFPAIGEFAQYIFTFNFAVEKNAYTDEGVFWSHDEDRAFYTSEYDPAGGEDAVVFWSDMWEGRVSGRVSDGDSGGSLRLAKTRTDLTTGELGSDSYGYTTIEGFGFGKSPQNHLLEEDSQEIADEVLRRINNGSFESFVPYIKFPLTQDRESELIEACDYEIDEDSGDRELKTRHVCYDPEVTPESDGEVRIENAGSVETDFGENAVIRVRTVAVVDSQLNCGNNQDECLTEQFENNAGVELEGNIDLDDEARLVVLCPYLITRNAGDVFLQVELEGGSNIACVFDDEEDKRYSSQTYANTDSLVILETPASTEEDEYIRDEFIETSYTLDVDLCAGDTDGVVGSLSSYVCEIVTEVSDLWRRNIVEQETDERVSQSVRNAFTSQSSNNKFTSFEQLRSELTNVNNPNSGILYFDGDAYGQSEIVIGGSGTLTIPEGAWTLIVENADLVIAGDIAYESGASFTNLPSMAFIVNGGDLYIKNNAHELVGVYYTDQSITGDERSPVDDPLEIDGSVYGNIQQLLEAAQYVGSPNLDEGGVVIRYDSRILLNTPPGLSEYVNVNSERAVN